MKLRHTLSSICGVSTLAFLASTLVGSAALARPRAQEEQKPTPPPSSSNPSAPTKPDAGDGDAPAPNATSIGDIDAPPGAASAGPTGPGVAPGDSKDVAGTKDVEKPTSADVFEAFSLHPYAAIAGGLKVDNVIDKSNEDRDDRFVTFAVSRFGILGKWDFVTVQSELMASGGIGLHGTSAYEGQAALQVRQQMVRVKYSGLVVEVGRLIDEASVDFISAHVQDTLVQDTATRDPLLYSGYNLGNGIRATYEIVPKLRIGLTVNAGNPVATTSTLAVGGTFPPFERLYTQAYQAVNQGPNHFPDDTFNATVVTPSVLYSDDLVDLRLAAQGFDINTNTTKAGDDHVRGYNLRGTARVKLLRGILVPFASAAYTRNDTLEPNNLERRAADRYHAVNLGGGVDANIARRFTGFNDSADGVGVQFQQVQFQVGNGLVTSLRYVNVGGSYWLTPHVAIGARAAMSVLQQKGGDDTGERNVIVGLRAIIP